MDFAEQRARALAILNKGEGLNRRSGSFLGQLACDPATLTPKQRDWFDKLCARAGLDAEG